MTFRSQFQGNETERSGTATFFVGTIERQIQFERFEDYHAIAQLLNEARRVGRTEAARAFSAQAQQWAREMEGM